MKVMKEKGEDDERVINSKFHFFNRSLFWKFSKFIYAKLFYSWKYDQSNSFFILLLYFKQVLNYLLA